MYIPVSARYPNPESGATDITEMPILNWQSGREAAMHEFYFSTDRQAVLDGTALVDTVTYSFWPCDPLDPGQTYYWKVNEANEVGDNIVWEGDVWEFTTAQK